MAYPSPPRCAAAPATTHLMMLDMAWLPVLPPCPMMRGTKNASSTCCWSSVSKLCTTILDTIKPRKKVNSHLPRSWMICNAPSWLQREGGGRGARTKGRLTGCESSVLARVRSRQ